MSVSIKYKIHLAVLYTHTIPCRDTQRPKKTLIFHTCMDPDSAATTHCLRNWTWDTDSVTKLFWSREVSISITRNKDIHKHTQFKYAGVQDPAQSQTHTPKRKESPRNHKHITGKQTLLFKLVTSDLLNIFKLRSSLHVWCIHTHTHSHTFYHTNSIPFQVISSCFLRN